MKYGIFALIIFLVFTSCSSKPKNPGDVYEIRRRAESLLEQGNKNADRGALDTAIIFLDEAFRIAIAADDPGLRIRAGLSLSNVLFLMGQTNEAVSGWNNALAEAQRIKNAELIAISKIHGSRGRLLTQGRQVAQSVKDEVSNDLKQIKSDQQYIAFAWNVVALAEKELGRYGDAEKAIMRSLDIHLKERNLELVAYNWFLIGSFRSLAGDYTRARQALENAINYDRRVENSWGLANDWRALGEVYTKSGDKEAANAAFTRSAEIFRALGNEEAETEILARINN